MIETLEHQIIRNESHVFLKLKKQLRHCPHCCTHTRSTNGSQTILVKHGILNDRPLLVHWTKHRYKCPNCKRTFMTDNILGPINVPILSLLFS